MKTKAVFKHKPDHSGFISLLFVSLGFFLLFVCCCFFPSLEHKANLFDGHVSGRTFTLKERGFFNFFLSHGENFMLSNLKAMWQTNMNINSSKRKLSM